MLLMIMPMPTITPTHPIQPILSHTSSICLYSMWHQSSCNWGQLLSQPRVDEIPFYGIYISTTARIFMTHSLVCTVFGYSRSVSFTTHFDSFDLHINLCYTLYLIFLWLWLVLTWYDSYWFILTRTYCKCLLNLYIYAGI
jgi:hypothetical protein